MWYDVRYIQYSFVSLAGNPEPNWREWFKVPAKDEEQALCIFRSYNKNATPLYAKRLEYEWDTRDRAYWSECWRDALQAVPYKIRETRHERWHHVPRGITPLPEFIEKRARGEMCHAQHDDGSGTTIIQKEIYYTQHEYGRASALGILLDYITWTGKDHKRKRANSCAMLERKIPERSRPRSAKARKLLATLPTYSKEAIKQMLAQKRKRMNHGTTS